MAKPRLFLGNGRVLSLNGFSEAMPRTKMKTFTAVIERCLETGLYVGYIPGLSGAHSQGKTLDELRRNLSEVLETLADDGQLRGETEYIGTQQIVISK